MQGPGGHRSATEVLQLLLQLLAVSLLLAAIVGASLGSMIVLARVVIA